MCNMLIMACEYSNMCPGMEHMALMTSVQLAQGAIPVAMKDDDEWPLQNTAILTPPDAYLTGLHVRDITFSITNGGTITTVCFPGMSRQHALKCRTLTML